MTTRTLTAAGRLTPLLRAGLIAGVAIAALAYPAVALGGLGVKTGAEMFTKLPAELRVVPAAQTSYVYAADGKTLITMYYEEDRRYIPLRQMSPYIQQAVVAAEDTRFFEHNGVDLKGIVRAFMVNRSSGGVSQGASTLTMQYVRAALRDSAQTPAEVQAATEQTVGRKLREMRLALRLEKELSKPAILERYLNEAYFGHRAYGIYAAAEVFFSKRPQDLTLDEAATLAGLVKAPTTYDPASSDRTAATQRRNYVIDRMADLQYISPAAAAKARAQPVKLRLSTPPNGCVSVPADHNDWGFFCDYLRNWWTSQPAFGATAAEREDTLRRGGFRIVTSLVPKIQQAAQKHVLDKQSVKSAFAHGLVVVQPGTGRVQAMAVNRVYSLDQRNNGRNSDAAKRAKNIKGNYPDTVNPLLGGGDLPGYQAGSTFKIFTMLAALEKGMPLSTTIYAPQRYKSQYLAGPGEPGSCGGRWCPQNASAGMTGKQSMWSGFGKSVNTYFVQLEQRVGAQNAVHMAERLGLQWRTDIDRLQASPAKAPTWGAFTLGVADTTPLEMANAYATVAAEGRYCAPTPVLSITTADGKPVTYTPEGADKPVDVAAPRCHQEVDKQVARAAIDAARCVTGYKAHNAKKCGSWSTAPNVYGMVGRPVAGKTGTTDSTRAAWFVGFTPDLAAASFVADPDNPQRVVGDWNSWKPISSVAQTLRDALKGTKVSYFTPPAASMER